MSFLCVFFNDSATTDIYTDGHPLSLHDALPISLRRGLPAHACRLDRRRPPRPPALRQRAAAGRALDSDNPVGANRGATALRNSLRPVSREPGESTPGSRPCPTRRRQSARSEEHTSELQSLMRISYAVFCLQKKKEKSNP